MSLQGGAGLKYMTMKLNPKKGKKEVFFYAMLSREWEYVSSRENEKKKNLC